MNIESVQKTYRRYAPRYDFWFGAVFHPGRKAVIHHMDCKPGEKILEVGVGTGLSLPLYPEGVEVTGIDISEEMLEHARIRAKRDKLEHVELHTMDAENMTFEDNSFDKVVAMYVASVVPDPVKLVEEMRRVCRPGGELMLVNHFSSSNPLISGFEKMLTPLSGKLGFNPGFSLAKFVDDTGLNISHNRRVNLFGYWKMLQVPNIKESSYGVSDEDAPTEISSINIAAG
ncbi:MAG TPA: methyltransferase domain-containing protein [Gammaproteobacteria bacterium]|nr:methyltransferase domain-containing protein [Gammaproteobacteria bacterium]